MSWIKSRDIRDQALEPRHADVVVAQAAGAIDMTKGAVPFVLALTVPAGATGNVEWTGLPFAIRVVDVHLVKTTAAGGGAGTIQVLSSASAITNAMSIDIADNTVARAGEINDANHTIASGGKIRVTRTRTASTDESCIVYVTAVRI